MARFDFDKCLSIFDFGNIVYKPFYCFYEAFGSLHQNTVVTTF